LTTTPPVLQFTKSYPAQRIVAPGPAGPTVNLQIVPEPRIDWVRTTGIRIEHAVDEQGRAVAANLTTPLREVPNTDDMVFLGGGRVMRQIYVDGNGTHANPFSASVPLKSDLPYPNVLRELRGAVLGVVKARSREVVSQALTVEQAPAGKTAAEDQRDIITRFVREPVPQTPTPTLKATVRPVSDHYVLSVVLSYSSGQYAVAVGDGRNSPRQIPQQIIVAQGGLAVVEGGRANLGKSDSVYGLRVTDAAGKPFTLTGSIDLSVTTPDGTVLMRMHLTLTTTKTDGTTGPPARIAWHASRLAAVEVPFELTNVPVVK
jgi:hypothetical protein